MKKNMTFFVLLILFLGGGAFSYFTLEGDPPSYYHFLFGPFLIFKYGHEDSYIGILGGIIFFSLIAMPTVFRKRYAIVLSFFGVFLWIVSAKIIEGISI